MKQTKISVTGRSSEIVRDLYSLHKDFHGFLDNLSAKTDDSEIILLLIEIRRLNLECIARYTGLLSRTKPSAFLDDKGGKLGSVIKGLKFNDMTLWNIHAQLARIIPKYQSALGEKSLSKVSKFIIARNYDLVVKLKEQLLHPVSESVVTG